MTHLILPVVFALLPLVLAFTSVNQYERTVLYGPSQLPTTNVSVAFLATNLDSTGTFSLSSGCTGTISVAPPTLNFIVTHIGNVPEEVFSFQEVSCSVTSIDAYRTALAASDQTLDVVLTTDGDNETIVAGGSESAFRRRLLQTDSFATSDPVITSFGATSKIRSDLSRESLDTTDRYLYSLVSKYSAVSVPVVPNGILSVINAAQSNAQADKNALQRLADVEAKLVQRGKNTDLAVSYLTEFAVDAYLQQRADYAQQQTQINMLLASQNATQLAVNTLFNATIANIQNLLNLTQFTASAIEGILDYRVADRSIFQSWIANDELRDLATALYFFDVDQLPANYTPLVRNPGIRPNASALSGPGARVLLDTVTTSSVYRIGGTNESQSFSGGHEFAVIFQHHYSTYISSETALLFDVDQMDSRFFLSLLGPPGCTPPYLNPAFSYVNASAYGDIAIGRQESSYLPQTFPSDVPCDMWIEAEFNNCFWQYYTGGGPTYTPSFHWSSVGVNTPLASICPNDSNTDGAGAAMVTDHMIITDITTLDSLLDINMCGHDCLSGWFPDTAPFCVVNAYQTGGFYDQTDLMYFSSQRLQLTGNTSTHDCVNINFCAQPLFQATFSATPPHNAFFPTASYCLVPTILPNASTSSVIDNYLAIMVVGYIDIDIDVSQLRLAKYGRLAGVETTTVSNNLYLAHRSTTRTATCWQTGQLRLCAASAPLLMRTAALCCPSTTSSSTAPTWSPTPSTSP